MDYSLLIEISKTFYNITQTMPNDALNEFIKTPHEQLNNYHFDLGLWIRNNLLKADTSLYTEFIKNNYNSSDEMSATIISVLHRYLNM